MFQNCKKFLGNGKMVLLFLNLDFTLKERIRYTICTKLLVNLMLTVKQIILGVSGIYGANLINGLLIKCIQFKLFLTTIEIQFLECQKSLKMCSWNLCYSYWCSTCSRNPICMVFRKNRLKWFIYRFYKKGFYMFGIYIMRHVLYILFVNLLCLRNDKWLIIKYQ